MRITSLAALATVSAVQYTDWRAKPIEYDQNEVWKKVKRGSVHDFTTMNVEKAMKLNPSSGTWPIPEAEEMPESNGLDNDAKRLAGQYKYWEDVVIKGNQAFTNKMVEKASKLVPEPIVIDGKIVNPPGNAPMEMPVG